MAPAIRADLSLEDGALIKALCTSVASSPTSSPMPSPTAQPTAPASVASVAHYGHIAAITDGAVGGVAGLTLITAVIFLILSRRKKEPTVRSRTMAQEHMPGKGRTSQLSMMTDAIPTDVTEPPPLQQEYATINHWLSTQIAGEGARTL
jgi:hypothetical protein